MSRLLFIPAILIAALAFPGPWNAALIAADRGAVEADIGDGPVIRTHVDEADCESGRIALDDLIERGRQLFVAKFNSFDGQGRPAATGNGIPSRRVAGSAPEFNRTSSPEANSCAGCHIEPRTGGSGDVVANVFVLAQVRDPVTDSVSAEFSNERNTLGMMGSGAIEMLAREMTVDLQTIRDAASAEAEKSRLPVVRDLASTTNIQIHVGNSPSDVQGCFAAGTTRSVDFVGFSKAAMKAILDLIAKDASGNIKVIVTGSSTASPAP